MENIHKELKIQTSNPVNWISNPWNKYSAFLLCTEYGCNFWRNTILKIMLWALWD